MKKKQGGLPSRKKRKCKERKRRVCHSIFFCAFVFIFKYTPIHVGLKNGGVSGGSGEEYLASTCIFGKLHIHRENYGTDYMNVCSYIMCT